VDHLILVKHSLPAIDPAKPAATWPLSDEGRRRCGPLAARLAPYQLSAVVASEEPKAAETAALVAARLGLPLETVPGLHEHLRTNVGWLGAAAFEDAVARCFARPDELVFGQETANQARDRFMAAIGRVLERHPAGSVAVVAHGTVISLFVAARAGLDPFALWRRLGLPAVVVLSRPDLALLTVVEKIDGEARCAEFAAGAEESVS
jgi:2,3-bisphosphoglycerate-dependent phosphoglycerate mutase